MDAYDSREPPRPATSRIYTTAEFPPLQADDLKSRIGRPCDDPYERTAIATGSDCIGMSPAGQESPSAEYALRLHAVGLRSWMRRLSSYARHVAGQVL
jgi:hypothetical protein